MPCALGLQHLRQGFPLHLLRLFNSSMGGCEVPRIFVRFLQVDIVSAANIKLSGYTPVSSLRGFFFAGAFSFSLGGLFLVGPASSWVFSSLVLVLELRSSILSLPSFSWRQETFFLFLAFSLAPLVCLVPLLFFGASWRLGNISSATCPSSHALSPSLYLGRALHTRSSSEGSSNIFFIFAMILGVVQPSASKQS